METRTIGSLTVSVIGLGCNNFRRRLDFNDSANVINSAIEAGITFFDTADVYGSGQSEDFIGRVLGPRRKDIVLATKFGNLMEGQGQGASASYIQKAVEASLQRLGTDYIDLYQLHTPDPTVPIAETLGALNDLVRAGKVREIGCSNYSEDELRAAEGAVRPGAVRFVSIQNEYSLLKRDAEQDVLPECVRTGIAFLPYFPLRSGLLTGKYRKGLPTPEGTRLTSGERYLGWLNDKDLALAESLIQFAESKEHTILELAFAWLLRWPVIASVIAGATKPDQVQANVAAAGWHLTATDLAEIDAILSRQTQSSTP
ncbi:MAG: aldo/keto reductase [Aggregatilineales bacterium]